MPMACLSVRCGRRFTASHPPKGTAEKGHQPHVLPGTLRKAWAFPVKQHYPTITAPFTRRNQENFSNMLHSCRVCRASPPSSVPRFFFAPARGKRPKDRPKARHPSLPVPLKRPNGQPGKPTERPPRRPYRKRALALFRRRRGSFFKKKRNIFPRATGRRSEPGRGWALMAARFGQKRAPNLPRKGRGARVPRDPGRARRDVETK